MKAHLSMKKSLFILMFITMSKSFLMAQTTVKDFDNNIYHTKTIGGQVWMIENLKTTHYRDGTPIPIVTSEADWGDLKTDAYCDYGNKPSPFYGKLYNWYAVTNTLNVCPVGWHVPADTEWNTLINFLGGETVAGGKLKEKGTAHWLTPNTDATNESGFTALPGGNRSSAGPYYFIGKMGYWWSINTTDEDVAWFRSLSNDDGTVGGKEIFKTGGLSVRCIKD